MRVALAAAAAALLLAGCGSHETTPSERALAREIADAGLVVGAYVASVDRCRDDACLQRRGNVAKAEITAQALRIQRAVEGRTGKCFAGGGRSFLAGIQAYTHAAALAAKGDRPGWTREERHAAKLTSDAVDDYFSCANTPKDATPMTHALLAVQDQIARINKCIGLGCLDQEGAALATIARQQQRAVDKTFEGKSPCNQAARRQIDRGFAALRRMGTDVRNLDAYQARIESRRSNDLFNESVLALQRCA